MTTNLDIIKRAMKKIHVLAAGTEPTSVQAAEAMGNLQSLYVELIGNGALGHLNDVLATADYTANENDRVRASEGVTVTLPLTITTEPCGLLYAGDYCASDYGFGYSTTPRPPRNLAPVVVIDSDGDEEVSIYNAYSGAWVRLDSLTQQNEFPFPNHFENGFAAMLAERIVDDFDGQLGAETKNQAGACRLMLSAKYDSPHRASSAPFF